VAGVAKPDFVQGVSLKPILRNPAAPGHAALGYNSRAKTIRTATHRLIVHKKGAVELYDHTSAAGETRNVAAEHPAVVAKLKQEIAEKQTSR